MIVNNTPWKRYRIIDHDTTPTCTHTVHVKREDMCCPHPGPAFSKIRGLAARLTNIRDVHGDVPIGVLDTSHSKAGWGASYICRIMGMKCIVFYPVYKSDLYSTASDMAFGKPYKGKPMYHTIRANQHTCQKLGALLVPLQAGRSAVLYHQAKKHLARITDEQGVMLPNALKLKESVIATAVEVIKYTPLALQQGTWIVSISSGTICAGVLRGLALSSMRRYKLITIVAHMGYSRSEHQALDYILTMADPGNQYRLHNINIQMVDEKYAYKDAVDNDHIPFPCNEYYDAKAFNWLIDHVAQLTPPVIFWNIGA